MRQKNTDSRGVYACLQCHQAEEGTTPWARDYEILLRAYSDTVDQLMRDPKVLRALLGLAEK